MTSMRSAAIVMGLTLAAGGCATDGSGASSTDAAPPDAPQSVTSGTPGTAVAVTVPTDANGFSALAEALDDARTHWSDAGVASYRLTVTEHRNHWSAGCTWTTVVTDGIVSESVVDPSSPPDRCVPIEWTVEQLHDQISSMSDSVAAFDSPTFGDHTLAVTFSAIGVPETIEFDLANGDDEEVSMQVIFAAPP